MAAWEQLKNSIAELLPDNSNNEISAEDMRTVCESMIDAIGGATYKGVADYNTNPGPLGAKQFWVTGQAGAYPNFGITFDKIDHSFYLLVSYGGAWIMQPVATTFAEASDVSLIASDVADVNLRVDFTNTRVATNEADILELQENGGGDAVAEVKAALQDSQLVSDLDVDPTQPMDMAKNGRLIYDVGGLTGDLEISIASVTNLEGGKFELQLVGDTEHDIAFNANLLEYLDGALAADKRNDIVIEWNDADTREDNNDTAIENRLRRITVFSVEKYRIIGFLPAAELAVQSLGGVFQGGDGKYYRADGTGDRDGGIFAGIYATGISELQYTDLTDETIEIVHGTSSVTIAGNSLIIGAGDFSSVKFASGKITSIECISDDLLTIYGDEDCTIVGTPLIGESEDYISWRNVLGYNEYAANEGTFAVDDFGNYAVDDFGNYAII